MTSAKEQLRSRIRQVRSAIPLDAALRAERGAAAQLLALPALHTASTVGLYAAIGTELRTGELATALRARGILLAYPRVVPGQRLLHFHRLDGLSELVPGPMRIPQPPAHAERIALDQIDVLVIPGLAFDRQGGRLGWGRGYYDATLSSSRSPLCIGYAHACQVVDEVPCSSHDVRMDLVVTDEDVVRVSARAAGPAS